MAKEAQPIPISDLRVRKANLNIDLEHMAKVRPVLAVEESQENKKQTSDINKLVLIGRLANITTKHIDFAGSQLIDTDHLIEEKQKDEKAKEAFQTHQAEIAQLKDSLSKISQFVKDGSLSIESQNRAEQRLKEMESKSAEDPLFAKGKLIDLLERGLLTQKQFEKELEEIEKPTEIQKISANPPPAEQPKPAEPVKSVPTLKINRATGEVILVEGDKTKTYIVKNRAKQEVLFALAGSPKQPVSWKILEAIAIKEGSRDPRPASGNINALRRTFGQRESDYELITTIGPKTRHSSYMLNANVEFVDSPVAVLVQSEPTQTESLKNIVLDKEKSVLIVGSQVVKLSKRELSLVSYLYDRLGQKVLSSTLKKRVDTKGKLGGVFWDIEEKFGKKIFTRSREEGKVVWSLDTPEDIREIVPAEAQKPIPTLKINRETGEVILMEGNKTKTYIVKNRAKQEILFALAGSPKQPISRKILEAIAIKEGSKETRPASGNIDALRRTFGQRESDYELITTIGPKTRHSSYMLNANVEFVDKPVTLPVQTESPKGITAVAPKGQEKPAQPELPKRIILDKKERVLIVDLKVIKLSKTELEIASHLHDHPDQQFSSRELSEILIKTGHKTIPTGALWNIEKKAGRQIFTRIGGHLDTRYSLGSPEDVPVQPEPAQIESPKNIALDKEKSTLIVGSKVVELSKRELSLVSYVYDRLGQKVLSSTLKKHVGAKGKLGGIFWDIEEKLGEKIFTRSREERKFAWSLGTLQDKASAETKKLAAIIKSRQNALNLIMNDPNATAEKVIEVLGISDKTQKLLNSQQAKYALTRYVGAISRKINRGDASREDKEMWQKIQVFTRKTHMLAVDKIEELFPDRSKIRPAGKNKTSAAPKKPESQPKIGLDRRDNSVLLLGDRRIQLQTAEFALIHPILTNKARVTKDTLKKILKDLRFKADPRWVIEQLEIRIGEKIFPRKKDGDIIYRLNSKESPEKPNKESAQLRATRIAALKLIMENPNVTAEEVINILGPSSKTKKILPPYQARYALNSFVVWTFIRIKNGTATEEEKTLVERIDKYKEQAGNISERFRELFSAKSTDEIQRTEEVKNPYLLAGEETEILMSLIASKDGTQIRFNDFDSVTFHSPEWIKELYGQIVRPETSYNQDALLKKRKEVLSKMKRIVEKDNQDRSTIGTQEESTAYLLEWLKSGDNPGKIHAPADIVSNGKRFTLEGLVNFLISNSSETKREWTTNREHFVQDHKSEYIVPGNNGDMEIIEIKTEEHVIFQAPTIIVSAEPATIVYDQRVKPESSTKKALTASINQAIADLEVNGMGQGAKLPAFSTKFHIPHKLSDLARDKRYIRPGPNGRNNALSITREEEIFLLVARDLPKMDFRTIKRAVGDALR